MKVLILAAFIAANPPQTLQGDAKNWGKNYSTDSRGNVRGEAKAWGKAWTPDGRGGFKGTAKSWGQNFNGRDR